MRSEEEIVRYIDDYNRLAKAWNDAKEAMESIPPEHSEYKTLLLKQHESAKAVLALMHSVVAMLPQRVKDMMGGLPVIFEGEPPEVLCFGLIRLNNNKIPKDYSSYPDIMKKGNN